MERIWTLEKFSRFFCFSFEHCFHRKVGFQWNFVRPLRPDSSGKGMGRVCERLRVEVPVGTNIYLSKKKMKFY